MTKSYEELLADMTGIIAKIYEKGYDNGYEQGKFDAVMDSAIEKYDGAIRKMAEETPQEKRDRIIERAKDDLETLKTYFNERNYQGIAYRVKPEYQLTKYADSERDAACHVEFIVNKEKRTIVALMRGVYSQKIIAKAIAKCTPDDCFNVHIGKAIALRRALGLEVPDEYLNAPQPTRVRKGDIVESTIHGKDHVFKVEVCSGEKPIAGKPHADAIYVKRAKIIDDSREEVSE